jgi:hypothetical protein
VDASSDSVDIGTTTQGNIAKFYPAEITFNEGGLATLDFRVESDNQASAIFLDSSADNLTINAAFQTAGGRIGKITTVTDTYTVLVTDETVICNKATNFTVTLPTAVVGQIFDISNINTGIVTVDGASTDTIDGDLTQQLLQWESMRLKCYIANKWKVQ